MTLATDIAICAAALTQPFTSDAERHALQGKLLRAAGQAETLQLNYAAACCTRDALYEQMREQDALDAAHRRFPEGVPVLMVPREPGRPVLAVVDGGGA